MLFVYVRLYPIFKSSVFNYCFWLWYSWTAITGHDIV